MKEKKPTSIVVFGGTGDLMKRKLLPTFAELAKSGDIAGGSRIIGVGRRDFSDSEYIEYLGKDIEKNKFLLKNLPIKYFKADIESLEGFDKLKLFLEECEKGRGTNRIFFLATGFNFFSGIVRELKKYSLNENKKGFFTRIVLEKPFGDSLKSAVTLEKEINSAFDEESIYRIDHYLAKDSILDLIEKKKDKNFESKLNNKNINKIEIIADEILGVEKRIGYYDKVGAVKDMVQNHLLETLATLLMDSRRENINKSRIAVLKDIKFVNSNKSLFGQYKSYKFEAEKFGIEKSKTETFANIFFECENDRWKGVEISIRTGKKLKEKVGRIRIHYKSGEYEDIDISTKKDEYASLLAGVIVGDKKMFPVIEEVLECWKIVEEIEKMKKKIKFEIYDDYQERV